MKYLTTSEFAKLCGTTKDTLIFYDRQGLFKPKHVSENKYRRYGVDQYYEFDIINLLKETGTSLPEIRAYLTNKSPKKMLDLLREKKEVLKQEKARLVRRQRVLDDLIRLGEEAMQTRYDVFELLEMNEEPLELMRINVDTMITEEGWVLLFRNFTHYFNSQGRTAPPPFGMIITRADAQNRQYAPEFMFCGATRKTPAQDRHVKPGGKYAVLSHFGDSASHEQAFLDLMDKIELSELHINGDVYAYDIVADMFTGKTEEFAIRYCIHIK